MSDSLSMLGNAEIWALPKVGFLSSRKVPPAAVMKCFAFTKLDASEIPGLKARA